MTHHLNHHQNKSRAHHKKYNAYNESLQNSTIAVVRDCAHMVGGSS